MIFTEGTIIMHKSGIGKSREQIVQQVKDGDPSINDYSSYIPIGEAVNKLTQWKNQRAELFYLTSRRKQEEIIEIKVVLQNNKFPNGKIEYRHEGEDYKDVAERIMPDVLIEDNCESIGGIDKMTITFISPLFKEKIISITVQEFGGIDHLENNISAFLY